MNKLNEKQLRNLFLEVWEERKKAASDRLKFDISSPEGDILLSPGLKVKNKDGELFTIVSVSQNNIVIKSTTDDILTLTFDEIESEYDLP